MSDATQSPETVAFNLYSSIRSSEHDKGINVKERSYMLDLYAECIQAVKGQRLGPHKLVKVA